MNRGAAVAGVGAAVVAVILACTDIPTDAGVVLSIGVDTLPSPSVVLGDTLRDSTGIVRPLAATAFNFQGDVIAGAPVRFSTRDRGITVDSITGIVVGDSLRSTPARIFARIAGLEAAISLDVTLRPDTVAGQNVRDSLLYSLTDTSANVSPVLSVKVLHAFTGDSAVKSYVVSFAVTSTTDTSLVKLVNDAGRASLVDTSDASGIAGRKVRLNAARLTSLADSVVVAATVKYRGAQLRGSPVRLVLKLRPRAP